MSTRFQYRATMEDGTVLEVTADQRDVAEFEVQPEGVPFFAMAQRPFTAARWLTWHALHRTGGTELDWAAFKAACVEVEDVTPEDAPEADPTQKAASADTSSS